MTSPPVLSADYHWNAWEGECITQMYERADDGALVIVIETGRVIIVARPQIKYLATKRPHEPLPYGGAA